jgi:photosystem II stability/assembly factor-like uncharacterized protein
MFFILTTISFSQQITKFEPVYYSPHYSPNGMTFYKPIAFLDSNNYVSVVNNVRISEDEEELRKNNDFGISVGSFIIKTTDGGFNWSTIKKDIPKFKRTGERPLLPIDEAFRLRGIVYPNKNTIAYYGAFRKYDSINHYIDPWLARIVTSNDGGISWKEHFHGNQVDGSYCLDLTMASDRVGYCFLSNSKIDATSYDIYKTEDLWENTKLILSIPIVKYAGSIERKIFVNNEGYLQIYYNKKVYFSNNDGDNLDSLQLDFSAYTDNNDYFIIKDIKMLNKNSGYIMLCDTTYNEGDSLFNRIFYTNDHFATYNEVKIGFSPNRLFEISSSDENNIILQGIFYKEGEEFPLIKTTDGGKTWDIIHLPVNGNDISLNYADYINKDNIFIACTINGTDDKTVGWKGVYLRNFGKTTLDAPIPIVNNNSSSKVLDTTNALFSWSRIDGADSYRITLQGGFDQNSLKFPIMKIANAPIEFKKEDKIYIETKDTFLLVKNLWHRAIYKFSISAFANAKSATIGVQQSEIVTLRGVYKPTGYLSTPKIIEPESTIKVFSDSLKIVWNKVDSAKGYDIALYVISNLFFSRSFYQFVQTDYKDTSYVIKQLQNNTDYKFIFVIGAVSDDDHSFFVYKEYYNYDPSGVKEYEVSDSYLYPNPVTDYAKVKIDSKFNGLVNVSIMDMQGNTEWLGHYNLDLTNHFVELNFSKYSQGLYTLLLDYGTSREIVKMIKE